MRRPSSPEVFFFLLGTVAAVAFWAISLTIDSTPTPASFNGWIVVLEQGSNPASRVNVSIAPDSPGGAGDTPRLRYLVAACGPTPFRGALLLGGNARLDNLQAVIPPAPSSKRDSGRPGETAHAIRTLKMLDVSTGRLHTYSDVQVVRLALPATACAPPGGEEANFFGAVKVVAGDAGQAVAAHSHGPLAIWTGPRSTQTWPYIGALPGVDPHSLGEFRFVQGLNKGAWLRPPGSRFNVDVGSLTEKAMVDFARPAPSSSTSLSWSRSEPYAAIARLTDTSSLGSWQTYLVLATIALTIGASSIAALFLRQPHPQRTEHEQGGEQSAAFERQPRASLTVLVLFVLLVRLAGRIRK